MALIKKYIAIDIGLKSAKVILGSVSSESVVLEQIHIFDNCPIEQDDSMRWDLGGIFAQVKKGIGKAAKIAGAQVWGLGVSTFGGDFGLLDSSSRLIENPYCCGEQIKSRIKREVNQNDAVINGGFEFKCSKTIYQLLAMKKNRSAALARAKQLLFMPDLINYFLCSKILTEYTIADTSGLMDIQTGNWSEDRFVKLSLPLSIMPKIVEPPKIIGQILSKVGLEIGCGPIPVISAGSNSAASALAAIDAGQENCVYIIFSDKYITVGIELSAPLINEGAKKYGFINQAGLKGTILLNKRISGLEMVEEYMAKHLIMEQSIASVADIADEVKGSCKKIKRKANKDAGDLVRAALEGLAFKVKKAIEEIEEITSEKIEVIHIVGGAVQNKLLCQFIADAAAKNVITGPAEAAAMGNILMQAKATGQVVSAEQIRNIAANSFEHIICQPQDVLKWKKHYERSRKFMK